jgi:hypothetical protein
MDLLNKYRQNPRLKSVVNTLFIKYQEPKEKVNNNELTQDENNIITAYRNRPEAHFALRALLGEVEESDKTPDESDEGKTTPTVFRVEELADNPEPLFEPSLAEPETNDEPDKVPQPKIISRLIKSPTQKKLGRKRAK